MTSRRKLETSKLQGYNSKVSPLRRRGSAGLVEKVGRSNTVGSTVSHKAEVLPEA
jgi:hypothetical protein